MGRLGDEEGLGQDLVLSSKRGMFSLLRLSLRAIRFCERMNVSPDKSSFS